MINDKYIKMIFYLIKNMINTNKKKVNILSFLLKR